MSKPVLLFDLDGVCCDLMKKWLAVYNHDYGDNLTEADITSWNWDEFVKPECGKRIYHYLNRPGFFADLEPIEGCVESLDRLERICELVVVTARHPRLQGLTRAWLDYHGVPVHRLHFLEGASKAPTALAEGLDCMVEDAPHNALALAEAGVPVLLFGRPYNQGLAHPLIHRCDGWADVLEQIRSGSLPGRPSQRFPA